MSERTGHPREHVLRPLLIAGGIAMLVAAVTFLALGHWAIGLLSVLIALGAYRNLRMLRDWGSETRAPPSSS